MDLKTMLDAYRNGEGIKINMDFVPFPINDAMEARQAALKAAKRYKTSKQLLLLEMAVKGFDAFCSETEQMEKAIEALENAGI